MHLHVAHGGDAVEPGVGGAVAQAPGALLAAQAQQVIAPGGLLRAQHERAHGGKAGLGALGDVVALHALGHALDERGARPGAEVLDGGIVHAVHALS